MNTIPSNTCRTCGLVLFLKDDTWKHKKGVLCSAPVPMHEQKPDNNTPDTPLDLWVEVTIGVDYKKKAVGVLEIYQRTEIRKHLCSIEEHYKHVIMNFLLTNYLMRGVNKPIEFTHTDNCPANEGKRCDCNNPGIDTTGILPRENLN